MTIKPVKIEKSEADGSTSHRINKTPKSPVPQHVHDHRNQIRNKVYSVDESIGSRHRRPPKIRANGNPGNSSSSSTASSSSSNSSTIAIQKHHKRLVSGNGCSNSSTGSPSGSGVSVKIASGPIESEMVEKVETKTSLAVSSTVSSNISTINVINAIQSTSGSAIVANTSNVGSFDGIEKSGNNNASLNSSNAISNEDDQNMYSGYNSGDEHSGHKEDLSPDEWEERDKIFKKAMSDRGFIVEEIAEDGACLFRSISLQIYGDQGMHEGIRQQTMDYIFKNREYFAQFVTEDIDNYVSRKRNNHVHGNHIEIQAMSEIYNRPVELYSYGTEPINIFSSDQINNGMEPLRLSYQRGSHYNAILNPYKATVGVGLGLAGYCINEESPNVKHMRDAVRLSEDLEIEQTMFEDKLKSSDWEATNEAIEQQIARESYMQYCRDKHKPQAQNFNLQGNPTISSSTLADGSTSCKHHFKSSPHRSPEANTFEPVECFSTRTMSSQHLKPDDDLLDDIDYDQRSSTAESSNFYCDNQVSPPLRKRRPQRQKRFSNSSVGNYSDGSLSPNKKRKSSSPELPGPSSRQNHQSSSSSEIDFPGRQYHSDKPMSEFYHSLLESSYANDVNELAQLSEEEMLQKALQMSRVDFMQKLQQQHCPPSP